MKRHSGFTLAEVLITLGIIGVVAAMTLPVLFSSTGDAAYKSGFKKMISSLNQAVTMNKALEDYNFADTVVSDFNAVTTSILGVFTKNMQVSYVVKSGTVYNAVQTNEEKFIAENTLTGDDVTRVAADALKVGANDNITVFLTDGTAITYESDLAGCTSAKPCHAIVDVNGAKGPNKLSNCQGLATATDDVTGNCTDSKNLYLADQFAVKFMNQQVLPNGQAAKFTLYTK